MRIRTILSIIFIIILSGFIQAKHVPKSIAVTVAKNILKERNNNLNYQKIESLLFEIESVSNSKSEQLYYKVSFDKTGFAIVSADDAFVPVLAYSFESELSDENVIFSQWMKSISEEISLAYSKKIVQSKEIKQKWEKYSDSNFNVNKDFSTDDPLLLTRWNQDWPYNEYCPEDSDGPHGHTYVGCVALSMAQVMKYYHYPQFGTGSNTYNHNAYGSLGVNFGNTEYYWNNMPSTAYESNVYLSEMLYHCGVSVNMNYGPEGSGAYTPKTALALKNYFQYSENITVKSAEDYTLQEWADLLRSEIDAGRPMIYQGRASAGEVGHAFNCDGYHNDDYFHFNWGWGGQSDGYFYIGNVAPSGYDFNYDMRAVVGIEPAQNNNNVTLIEVFGNEGSFNDGSGFDLYSQELDCKYLIAPFCGSFVDLEFSYVDLADGDTLFIYDGETTESPLLAKFSSESYLETLRSTAPSVLMHFVSYSNDNSHGWALDFKSGMCDGDILLTSAGGEIEDGSGECDYGKSNICQWIVNVDGADSIRLDFTEFDLADDLDNVKIYKGSVFDNEIVSQYDFDNYPEEIIVEGDKLTIRFFIDSDGTSAGWKCNYSAFLPTSSINAFDNSVVDYLSVFPNPVTNVLNVQASFIEEVNSIEITDVFGRIVYQKEMTNCFEIEENFNVSTLSNGLYFLNFLTNNGIVTQKMLKK